jgi:hypothetical protein
MSPPMMGWVWPLVCLGSAALLMLAAAAWSLGRRNQEHH